MVTADQGRHREDDELTALASTGARVADAFSLTYLCHEVSADL
jgi:hypothetical protein